MKNCVIGLAILLVFSCKNIFAQMHEDFAQREVRESLQRYHEILDKFDQMPRDQALTALGEMMVRTFRWQDERSMEVYNAAQSKLISLPGHATYYRDKINALREQLLAGKLSLEDWDDQKRYCFQVLEHMPSEEAVEVLCGFAGDDFATGAFDDPRNAHIPGMKDWRFTDYFIEVTVCMPAMSALRSLQIEDPPSLYKLDAARNAMVWRQWWQEVKSGKRKYRFKGSSVEHPVNPPPGTFREQRRPERPPKPPPGTKAPEHSAPPPAAEKGRAEPIPTRWPVIAGVIALLMAVAAYMMKRTHHK